MADRRAIRRYLIWGALAVLIFGLHWIGVFNPVYDWTRVAFSPITGFFYQNSSSGNGEGLTPEARKALENEIQNLLVENSRLQTKLDDINDLKVETDFLENAQLTGTPAKIIGNTTDNFSKLYIINRGASDDIREGQGVIAGEGYLVGVVDTVREHTAFIRPLNDSQIAIAAKVQNTTNSPGMVKGRHGLSVHMELIPQTEEIQIGQRVVTSELMDNIPPNILIGVIDQIESQDGELFQSATIAPLYNDATLRVVTVL